MRVAVDAMGGDHAPRELVAGALEAARGDPDLEVVLVGLRDAVEVEVETQGGAPANLAVVHAAEVVAMDDRPVAALKTRPDASVLKTLHLLRSGRAGAAVAAGSTGAVVAAAQLVLKMLPGVRRAGIAVPIPARNPSGVCLLIDAGASVDCRADQLFQFGVMGASYYATVFGVDRPRVGLVSVGEEETKGNELTQRAAALLREGPLNFVGNVEGRDLFGGACEVAVADGFVGNIVLKSTEGCAEMLFGMVSEVLAKRNPDAILSVARKMDYAELGGAPLLGVDGVVLVCHGRSPGRAIANAIRAAGRVVDRRVNDAIVRGLGSSEGAGNVEVGA